MAAFTQGHALLIGVGRHQHHPQLDVPITVADAQAVQAVLQNPDLCGYPPEQVTLLANSQATTAGILQALDDLSQLDAEQTLFLFFAGHGALGTDGNYYLVTHDAQITGNKVTAGTGLSAEQLLEKLRVIPARRCLMIFNACHSAHIGPGTLAPAAPFPTLNPSGKTAHALLGAGEGRILIVAARKEQYSYFDPGAKHTFFTQKLVEGLEGEATANGGYIGAFGLYEYLYHEVKEAVQAKYGVTQEPVLTAVQTVGSFPIALYRGATALGGFAEGVERLADTGVEQIAPEKAARALGQFIQINTGGGAFIGGNVVTNGGAVVGRDQIIVSGSGAVAAGKGATAVGKRGVHVGGNIGGSVITGDGNQVIHGSDVKEVSAAFAAIKTALVQAQLNPVQKRIAETAVTTLEIEAQKGEHAEEAAVQDGLAKLLQIAPDIGEVVAQTCLNPFGGLPTIFNKVARKMQKQ